jgi:hypothetical protein
VHKGHQYISQFHEQEAHFPKHKEVPTKLSKQHQQSANKAQQG